MVHWWWFYLLIVRNVQDLPPAHVQNLPQVTSKSKEAKSRRVGGKKTDSKERQDHSVSKLKVTLRFLSPKAQPASSHLRLII
jgi:hypothetical protein